MALDISDYLANQTPSGVSPTTGQSATDQTLVAGAKNLSSSYTTFLTLLTAQLKNQDPTSPLDTNNFTQQLTQMTGVQQQLLTNQLLQQLVSQKDGYSAVGLIGQTATAAGGDAKLTAGSPVEWRYALADDAASAALTISNAKGEVVWTGEAPDLTAGRHPFEWDGKTSSGADAPEGTYTLKVVAKAADGTAIASSPYIVGVVSSIENTEAGTMVQIGPASVPLSAIIQVGG